MWTDCISVCIGLEQYKLYCEIYDTYIIALLLLLLLLLLVVVVVVVVVLVVVVVVVVVLIDLPMILRSK